MLGVCGAGLVTCSRRLTLPLRLLRYSTIPCTLFWNTLSDVYILLIVVFLSCFGMSVSQHYWNKHIQQYCTLINSWRAYTRVTVVGLCLCVR